MTLPLSSQNLTVTLRIIETLENLGLSYHLGGSIALLERALSEVDH